MLPGGSTDALHLLPTLQSIFFSTFPLLLMRLVLLNNCDKASTMRCWCEEAADSVVTDCIPVMYERIRKLATQILINVSKKAHEKVEWKMSCQGLIFYHYPARYRHERTWSFVMVLWNTYAVFFYMLNHLFLLFKKRGGLIFLFESKVVTLWWYLWGLDSAFRL